MCIRDSFENRAGHDSARREKPEEVAASGFIKITVGIFRARRSDDALAQMGSARYRRLDEFETVSYTHLDVYKRQKQ